jgi:CBS domain-containing protein
MEDLLAMARRPAISIDPNATVQQAAALMVEKNVGAVVVLAEGGKLAGILSERDVVSRVVVPRLDPDHVRVAEVMTRQVRTATPGEKPHVALETMVAFHFRHLPIVDSDGVVQGMLSVRHLLREQVGELSRRNADLANFLSADGGGG